MTNNIPAPDVERVTHDSLHEAQLAVMSAVPYVQKQKTQGLNYTFASEAELIGKLHPAMRRHGITVRPSGITLLSEQEYQSKGGARMVNVRALVTFTFHHGTEEADVVVMSEAADSGDKASPKMMTMALKYALRQFFLIETGDDPDEKAHKRAFEADQQYGERVKMASQAICDAQTNAELQKVLSKIHAFPPEAQEALRELAAQQPVYSTMSELAGSNEVEYE